MAQKAKVRLSIELPAEDHRALKIEAAERGKTMAEIILEALRARPRLVVHENLGP